MSHEDEDELIGEKLSDVPKIDSGEDCNGKTKMKDDASVVRDDDGDALFGGYCSLGAGLGTDHLGEGRCMYHGGCTTGAPEGNQNRTTHGLNADLEHYYESLDDDGQAFVDDVSEAILSRYWAGYDSLDEELAHQVAVKLHIISKASDYAENEAAISQIIDGREERAALLNEISQYDMSILDELDELGVLGEPDEEHRLENWRDWINESSNHDQ
ncbi:MULTISPECIES: hypothetical protein [Natrialbaceae]|uniref:hypothetical protein n=1 Tax=Natrialbaceae TaxID=1644061 RepID=UPI00207D2D26|nr:hypothetical protein [Natronococcus sp. CG52]